MMQSVKAPSIKCNVCLDSIADDDRFTLSHCKHIFHEECTRNYLKAEISAAKCPLICLQYQCKIEFSVSDMKQLLTTEELDRYYDYSLKHALSKEGDISWCPTADCNYAFIYDPDDDDNEFNCPKCQKHYCLQCRVAWHKDSSCAEY